MDVRLYERERLREACTLALKNRLYVSGWGLSAQLILFRSNSVDSFDYRHGAIALAFDGEKPVALALREGTVMSGSYMAFCKKEYRRRGFASACVTKVKIDARRPGPGVDGSRSFWLSNDLRQW